MAGKYYDITKTLHVAPQQRSAIIQVEMVEIPKGTKVNDRLRSGEIVEGTWLSIV
jgi:translation elongation factor P/translation initiation factor 5A